MLNAYPAILKGDRLVWTEKSPPDIENGGLTVYVLVIPAEEKDIARRRKVLAEALEALAESGAFSEITDPVAWQREIRRDRSLPGRDDG